MKTSAYWLFSFKYYLYCQGTRDGYEGIRLIKFTLPCEEFEAKNALIKALNTSHIEFDEDSIESLNVFINNS
jgi:hypothetical protein